MDIHRLPKRLLTAEEIANALGVHRATVRKWAREGKIPSFRTPTGRLRFDSVAVAKILIELQKEP
jgi:excisionase family DNA binding protein